MMCGICRKELAVCTCPDIEERLESLRGKPGIDERTLIDIPLAEIRKRRAKDLLCTCMTKTPDPKYHDHDCPIYKNRKGEK